MSVKLASYRNELESVKIPRSALFFSFLLHLTLFLAILTIGKEAPNLLKKDPKKSKKASEVFESLIQVDVVALPDQMLSQLNNVDVTRPIEQPVPSQDETAKLAKEAAAKEQAEMELAKVEKEKKIAEKKKKKAQEEALKKLKKEAQREKALKKLSQQQEALDNARKALKGNRMAQGNSASGKVGTPSERWAGVLQNQIKQNFYIFPWQNSKTLLAVVFIRVYPNGQVREKKIVQSSNDPTYDRSVLQAIDASQPLAMPDEPSLIEEGINVTIRP